MRSLFLTGALILAAAFRAADAPQFGQADVQVQLGDLLFAEGRYADAAEAYRRATGSQTVGDRAGAGLVLTLLRLGDFNAAYKDASALRARYASSSDVA